MHENYVHHVGIIIITFTCRNERKKRTTIDATVHLPRGERLA